MPRTTRSRRPLIVHSVWLQAKYETEEVLVWYRGRRRRRLWPLILNTMRLREDKVVVCLVRLEKMRILILRKGSYRILFILELGHSTDQSKVVSVKRILLVQCLLFGCTLSRRSYIKQKPISPLLLPLQKEKESIRVSSGICSCVLDNPKNSSWKGSYLTGSNFQFLATWLLYPEDKSLFSEKRNPFSQYLSADSDLSGG